MSKSKISLIAVHAFASILLAAAVPAALAQSDQTGKGPATPAAPRAKPTPQSLVDAADRTFGNFMRDPQMTWLHDNIRRAKAVLIAPEVAKAGFIFGGSGGRAVLRGAQCQDRQVDAARRSIRWRPPASASRPAYRSRK